MKPSSPALRHRLFSLALIVTLGLSLGGCAWLASLFKKPTIRFQDMQLTSVNFQGIDALFRFAVDNPNAIGLDLAHLDYQLTVDGHVFAVGHANQAVQVPANGTGLLRLPVGVRFADFVKSLEALFSGRDRLPYGLSVTVGLNTPIGVLDFPVSTQGTFPVPKPPSISMANVAVAGVDPTGANIQMVVHLTNPNPFPIPLANLNYSVSVGGQPVATSSTGGHQIGPGATQAVPINVRVDFMRTGLALMGAITSGGANIALDGALDFGVWKKPVHLEQRLGR